MLLEPKYILETEWNNEFHIIIVMYVMYPHEKGYRL